MESVARTQADLPGQAAAPVLDSLDEGSFANLRDKIQAKLVQPAKNNGKSKAKTRSTRGDNSVQDSLRGKKRDASGQLIVPHSGLHSKAETTNETELDSDADELRKALAELGGTQEDIDLINGAISDSEMEGVEVDEVSHDSKGKNKGKKSKTLEQGMANILKEISLAHGQEGDMLSDEHEAQEPARVEHDQDIMATSPISKASKKSTSNSKLKCEPRANWFTDVTFATDAEPNSIRSPPRHMIDALQLYAQELLDAENEAFRATQQTSSSQAFYNTVIASGTLSDKISALTLAVQESPIHNVKALETLISMAGKRNRAQAIDVLRALKDLFAQGSLLPSDRRLYAFSAQPAMLAAFCQVKSWKQGDRLPSGIAAADLIHWVFESWLKQQYFEIIKILETWCNDEIEYSKSRSISYISELLREKPEQESNLLRLLVNKLGDPIKKIASQTSYLLMQLLITHPAMKMVVISAIEADFIFRPGQSMHGKYYAVVTINQTALSTHEEAIAQKLLSIYFSLFSILLKPDIAESSSMDVEPVSVTRGERQRKSKKGKPIANQQAEELREKLISAVLTGVNRAHPYAGPDQKHFTEHLDTLFKITHAANFNTSIQAMMLIQQLTTTHQAGGERFYRSLYESLLDPRLISASKQQLYLNLLHRSLKVDFNLKRVKAFVKRILQILSLHDPPFVCAAFFLLKDLEVTFPSLAALIDQPEDREDDEEEVFQDADKTQNHISAERFRMIHRLDYDGHKRAPEHANADSTCSWDLLPYLAHYHPSVSISADHYVQHLKLPGKPDLTIHTMIHFLDRFVYRNPKTVANKVRGVSVMQPMMSDDAHAVLISSAAGQTGPAVNTSQFRNKKDEDVAAEDVFFHRYFSTSGKDSKAKATKKQRTDEEEGLGSEDEDAVWKAMIDSAPDLEGAESEEEDLDVSDLDNAMNSNDDAATREELEIAEEDDSGVDIEAGIFDDSDEELSDLEAATPGQAEPDLAGIPDDSNETAKSRNKHSKEARKQKKSLPTFASAADYAKMLEDDEDEDMG